MFQDNASALDPESRGVVTRVLLIIVLALFLTSLAAPELRAATFHSLVFLAALISALVALFTGQRVNAPTLTRWDEAAAFLLLSIIAEQFVDPEVLREAARASP